MLADFLYRFYNLLAQLTIYNKYNAGAGIAVLSLA